MTYLKEQENQLYNEKSLETIKNQGFLYGRSDGIRTHGLLVPNQARYQTSPHPEVL